MYDLLTEFMKDILAVHEKRGLGFYGGTSTKWIANNEQEHRIEIVIKETLKTK